MKMESGMVWSATLDAEPALQTVRPNAKIFYEALLLLSCVRQPGVLELTDRQTDLKLLFMSYQLFLA